MPVPVSHGTVKPAMFNALVSGSGGGVIDDLMRRATSRSGSASDMYPSVPSVASPSVSSVPRKRVSVSFKEDADLSHDNDYDLYRGASKPIEAGEVTKKEEVEEEEEEEVETVKSGTLKMLCREIDSLQKELVGKDRECTEAHEKYESLLTRNLLAVEGHGGVSMVLRQTVPLQEQVEAARSEIASLQSDREALQKEIQKLRKHDSRQQQQIANLENELSSTRSNETSLIDHLKLEVKELKASLSEATLAYTDLVAKKCTTHFSTVGCNTTETGPVTSRELELIQEMRQLKQEHESPASAGVTPAELASLLETVRQDLDTQLLDLRQNLIAHHVEGQMKLKADTAKRLSELTSGVEEQLIYLHHTAALQKEYGLQVSSVADLEKEIDHLQTTRKEKEQQLRGLQRSVSPTPHLRPNASPSHHLTGEMSSLLSSLRRSTQCRATPPNILLMSSKEIPLSPRTKKIWHRQNLADAGRMEPSLKPSDELLSGEMNVEKAEELRSHALAAEVDGCNENALVWYQKEMRVWMHLMLELGKDDDDIPPLFRTYLMEFLRCSEGVSRCYALEGNEDMVIKINKMALGHAEAIQGDQPVVAGIKVHIGDSYSIFAMSCEEERESLMNEPEDSLRRRQMTGDEWRLKIVNTADRRDEYVRQAREYYSDAAVSFKVHNSLTDKDVFNSHITHCLAKIAEGYSLSENIDMAQHYRDKASENFSYSSSREKRAAWDHTQPYTSGFDHALYDEELLEGDRKRMTTITSCVGGYLNQDNVVYKHNTWVPTVHDVHDILLLSNLDETLAATVNNASRFMDLLGKGDGEWRTVVKAYPLLAYIGIVEDMPSAVVIAASSYTQLIVKHTLSTEFQYHEHLHVWSNLSEREIAKCHGNDWEKKRHPFRLPLIEAIRSENITAVILLLDLGSSPLACSPHDMIAALPSAMETNNEDIMKLLLQVQNVKLDWEPPYELESMRKGVDMNSVVSCVEVAEEKKKMSLSKIPFDLLWFLVVNLPKKKALKWYDQHQRMFLTVLNGRPDSAKLISEIFNKLLFERITEAIATGLSMNLLTVVPVLSDLVTHAEKIRTICFCNDTPLIKLLLTCSVDINSKYNNRPIVSYHLEKGNTDIVKYICDTFTGDNGLDESMLTQEERDMLDKVSDKWGLSLVET